MLPEIEKGLQLAIPHFPTKFQAVIFRLWEMVPAKRLAEVLETDEATVCRLASDMGLGEQKWLDEWMERGYISILRQVWNIFDYEQLCRLLDWDKERLSYVLKEDDFLRTKLAGWKKKKTDCEKVVYRPLTTGEVAKTAKIRLAMQEEVLPLIKNVEPPFEFFRKRYAPLGKQNDGEILVDSSWAFCTFADGLEDYVEDFKSEVKNAYGVEFCTQSDRRIEVYTDVEADDEEYHKIDITDDKITIRAGSPIGIMRGLNFLLDLAGGAGSLSFDKKCYSRKTKVKTRFIYSFCGLYGDVLDKDSHISFPDELLRGYARAGINGVWIQGVFYKLAPYPFDEKKSEGWEKRLSNLDELTKRCARYGIKVYMYINEPRTMPLSFFEKRPELKGTEQKAGYASLCSSHPETQQYLKDTIETICKNVPLLGGFVNITQSENMVLCYSGGVLDEPAENNPETDAKFCPVCRNRKASEVTAEILSVMANAAQKVNPNIRFFAYAWAWKTQFKHELSELIRRLPKNVIVLEVSETGIEFERGGIKNTLRDYSLSIVGPGPAAKELWEQARSEGLEVAAKVQINNSWECSTAPFLPVYENVLNHMKNLTEAGIEHVMLSWTLGGYISDNIKIASAYFFEEENAQTDEYERILKNSYGEYSDCVKEAVSHFCKGFSEYPFDIYHIYDGPSNSGAANLLYPEPSGMEATMTCYPFDVLEDWCGGVYTSEVLEMQYEKLCTEWEKGLKVLDGMPLCEFYDMAVYGYTLFRGAFNQISYYILRDGKNDREKMREIVRNELELAKKAYEIVLRNSAVGYEAANHYYVTRSAFMEKIVQCCLLLDEME